MLSRPQQELQSFSHIWPWWGWFAIPGAAPFWRADGKVRPRSRFVHRSGWAGPTQWAWL